jgi:hypothetical protein
VGEITRSSQPLKIGEKEREDFPTWEVRGVFR